MAEKYAAGRLQSRRIDRAVKRAQQASARKLPYHLYIWRFVPAPPGLLFERRGYERGRAIGHYLSYKALLMDAHFRAKLAGYPKSRWMDLFDWNYTGGRQ